MISMKTIYGLSGVLMFVSVSANLYNLIISWDLMSLASKISYIFGTVLFQLMIMISFFVMFKLTPKVQTTQIVDEKDITGYLSKLSEEYKLKEVKQ